MEKLKRPARTGLKYYPIYIGFYLIFVLFNHLNGFELWLNLGRSAAQVVVLYVLAVFVLFLKMNRYR